MLINQANLDTLRTDLQMGWEAGYGTAEVWSTKLAMEVASSAASNTYAWVAQQLKLREWIGPRVAQNLSEHSYTLVNKEFEGTVEIPRPQIRDDNLGMYSGRIMPQLGVATKQHPDVLLASLLTANPLAFDGLSFFNTAHLTFNGAGTYSNDFATSALSAANFNAAWATMVSYTGEDGMPLGVVPNLIIIPPQLALVAKQILQSTTMVATGPGSTSAAIDNVLKGWADILVVPQLASAPTIWYLADVSKTIMPFVHQTREAPIFVSRDNMNDPKVFDLNVYTYGVQLADNMGVTLPFLISRNTP